MIELRRAEDIGELLTWRAEVIRAVFGVETDRALIDANRAFYETHVADGSHVAIVAAVDGVDCGCAAICFSDEMPSPDNPSGRCGYLMNIYVRENFRTHGVAHAMGRHLIAEATDRGCGKIYLETTPEGRPIYRSIGFREMADMMKYYGSED